MRTNDTIPGTDTHTCHEDGEPRVAANAKSSSSCGRTCRACTCNLYDRGVLIASMVVVRTNKHNKLLFPVSCVYKAGRVFYCYTQHTYIYAHCAHTHTYGRMFVSSIIAIILDHDHAWHSDCTCTCTRWYAHILRTYVECMIVCSTKNINLHDTYTHTHTRMLYLNVEQFNI